MRYRIMASRHSAFYSPLLCAIEFLKRDGHEAAYSVLGPGQQTHALIRDNAVDIMQSAVSSNWNARERGVEPLPVHFALINRRDGFFLAARQEDPAFTWKKLEGATLLADHGPQPLAMLKYAVQHNGVEWSKIKVLNLPNPERMVAAFREGRGDYLHLQAPILAGEAVASVGAAMPPVAFSSLCCSREYRKTEAHRVFVETYTRAREWARSAPAEEVAAAEASYFPQVEAQLLTDAVAGYQALGCWDGGIEIARDLYDQAIAVFLAERQITWRHPYDEVVG
jgi:NitT/TauT family transport system substrate-binding protein